MGQKILDYTGYVSLAIFEDGSWVAPAQEARGGQAAIAVWTTQGYKVREGLEIVSEFCDKNDCFLEQ